MEPRQSPIGAEPRADTVHFRFWAPDHEALAVQVEGRGCIPLHREEAGFFVGVVADLPPNARYKVKLSTGELIPDPASRFQPAGPHGFSQVVDPRSFKWTDQEWLGRSLEEYVIYEMHIGTFTQAGTWQAAMCELAELAAIGVTCIELMPVAEFAGR